MNTNKLGDGTLRRNERKYELVDGKWAMVEGKERHPDYKGNLKLQTEAGEISARISAWVRKGQEGQTFLSLSFEYPQNESRRLTIAGQPPHFEKVLGDVDVGGNKTYEDLPF